MKNISVLILGAGPTGLGAAYELEKSGKTDYLIVEKNAYPGGLATSFVDPQGFTWDIGGHVIHSHYRYFDEMFDRLIKKDCHKIQREAWVWLHDTFSPYPFQNNLWRLPKKVQTECLSGIDSRPDRQTSSANFQTWILETFGEGIAKHFLFPLNQKTWAFPLEKMSSVWVKDRVSPLDPVRIKKNTQGKKDDVSWGPNNVFFYPKKPGGTGFIWKTIAKTLPPKKMKYNRLVTRIDLKNQVVETDGGKKYHYQKLISSLPLTTFLKISNSPLQKKAKKNLHASGVHVIGLGFSGQPPKNLQKKSWMYFPEKNIPFFRATVFSNYAASNVPQPGKQWSLMCEVAESKHKPVDRKKLIDDVIQAVKQAGFISDTKTVVSTWHHFEKLGYPTPTLARDTVIDDLLKHLQKQNVYSRGRFGAWKYEVSNMDHTFMQGVEAVKHILFNQPEITVWDPNAANKKD